jgi:hypothetical protein
VATAGEQLELIGEPGALRERLEAAPRGEPLLLIVDLTELSLATIAAWCGTSIQMISAPYGRIIRRHEGASPIELDEQFRAGKVEAMSLVLPASERSDGVQQGGSTSRVLSPHDAGWVQSESKGHKLPRPRRRKGAV